MNEHREPYFVLGQEVAPEVLSLNPGQSISDLTDDGLVLAWAVADNTVRNARERKDRIEYEILNRLSGRGATALLHPFYDVKVERPATLDPERLRPLAEDIPPGEWARGFTEAHQELVPAKADLRVVKGWAKYGAAIAERIAHATVLGEPRLKITPKKG